MMRFFKKKQESGQEMTDDALLERYRQSGSPQWLGLLYERYMPMVYGVCLKVLKDPVLAEDAVVNIYEELNEKVLRHEIAAFRGWLYVLARNHCLMELRRRSKMPTDSTDPSDMAQFGLWEEMDLDFSEPATALLERCLEKLAEWQVHCVRLFYFENLSYKEIGDRYGLETGLVRSHIQNGRRNLKICIERGG